ncbi:hypothetical protein [Enterococcus casseliflavus]|uniref:hypothetical protein n=1 Tax=Enterococcus casseliflavus TaxID=37734 RepID=UPI0011A948E4|nr:hypothetical protein [Enterococcus casseliflavus]
MGFVKHNSMIVTVSPGGTEMLPQVYKKAQDLFGNLVSNIIISPCNGYKTFFIATSGSKHGWEEQIIHKSKRQVLEDYIDSLRYEDDSNSILFVDVSYDENHRVEVERTNKQL